MPATYSITDGTYKIESSGGGCDPKAILDYYRLFSKPWPPSYEGPNDYIFKVAIKINRAGGGVVFRVEPGSQEKHWRYYRVFINKDVKKIWLHYMNEDPGWAAVELKTVDVPGGVNINGWFHLSVKVQGDHIQVYIEGKKVIDVRDYRGRTGGVGLMICPGTGGVGCSASFDWAELDVLTTTVTSTVTSTTALPPSTVTATVTAGAPPETVTETATVTETLTATGAATTVTETVTEAVTSTTTAPPQTTTITETMTAPGQTITQTVTETQVAPSRCLIATAAFGSEIAPQVQVLREFRDGFVVKTFAGKNFMRAFNAFYYSWSPYVAQAEYGNEPLRAFIRASIYPLLWILELSRQAAEPLMTMPELAVLVSGLIASSLIGLIYFAPIILAISLAMRLRGRALGLNPVYPLATLTLGLLLFALAELVALSTLMIAASSIIVLSAMALSSIAPTKLLSVKSASERR